MLTHRFSKLVCVLIAITALSAAERRVVLVIGNDQYPQRGAQQQLRKAVNDAQAVGDAFAALGGHSGWVSNCCVVDGVTGDFPR